MKTCSMCGDSKTINEFHLDRHNKDGRCHTCKACRSNKEKKRHQEKGEIINERKRKRYAASPELKMRNRTRCVQWQKANRRIVNEKAKEWYAKHPENARERAVKRCSTPKGKLNRSMRGNMWQSLRAAKSRRRWESLAGYTVAQLKKHLEKRFTPGMTWENYGTVWEIDHKIPIAVFNYEKPEDLDFRLCWSLKNLQPLRRSENRSKQDHVEVVFQPSLALNV